MFTSNVCRLSLGMAVAISVACRADDRGNRVAQAPIQKIGHSTFDERPAQQQQLLPLPSDGWSPLDSLEVFVGLEGSKQPQDFGVNAHFGGRGSVNWAAPLAADYGLGIQIGTSGNWTDHAVRVTSQIDGASSRTQSFTTAGLFQRTDSGFNWGVVYDFLYQRDYDRFTLSQWRGQAGYQVSDTDQVGVFGMVPQKDDRGDWGGVPVKLSPLMQGAVFWRHTWENQAETGFWIGASEGHGRVNVALGDASDTSTVPVFGSDLHIPLSDSWAMFGQANFICPADTGTVDAFLGLAYYPGGKSHGWRRRTFSPLLPVANNTTFSVDLDR